MRIGVTGSNGFLGWHASVHVYAEISHARFQQRPPTYELKLATRETFADPQELAEWINSCDAILHMAGVNRADSDQEVYDGNKAIAEKLVAALKSCGRKIPVVYANSTQSEGDSLYGQSKKYVADILRKWSDEAGGNACIHNFVLPHLFGEQARANYNNVTATFCKMVANGEEPESVNPDGQVELVHASDVISAMLKVLEQQQGNSTQRLTGFKIKVVDLLAKLKGFHELYSNFMYPDLSDDFDLKLFNTYRQFFYPGMFPAKLNLHTDDRGRLFEAAKGGGGGQTFVSWTKPGVTRGQHFHLQKVERFLVLEGKASISIRKVLSDERYDFEVSSDDPVYVDIPTLWTHNIINTGDTPLLTMFWSHDIFDPKDPDTFADPV